jgi:hypothetical protein
MYAVQLINKKGFLEALDDYEKQLHFHCFSKKKLQTNISLSRLSVCFNLFDFDQTRQKLSFRFELFINIFTILCSDHRRGWISNWIY